MLSIPKANNYVFCLLSFINRFESVLKYVTFMIISLFATKIEHDIAELIRCLCQRTLLFNLYYLVHTSQKHLQSY